MMVVVPALGKNDNSLAAMQMSLALPCLSCLAWQLDHYLVAQTITDRNMQLILRASRVEVDHSHHHCRAEY